MEERSDEQLASAYRSGDETAFDFLVRRHLDSIYRFLFRLSGDAETAEELTQESFVKAWKHIGQFDEKRKFKTWLFAIAKNAAADFFKKKRNVPFSFLEDESGNSPIDAVPESALLPDDLAEQEDMRRIFSEALNRLPRFYAAILTLHYREDFSLREIADILGKPYNTVKTYHVRALALFKKNLSSDVYPKR